jgi:hypothetical protein
MGELGQASEKEVLAFSRGKFEWTIEPDGPWNHLVDQCIERLDADRRQHLGALFR